MTLHILHSSNQLPLCKALLREADALLLLDEGITCLIKNLNPKELPCRVLLLQSDLTLEQIVPAEIEQINIDQWVELVYQHAQSISWS